MHVVKLFHMTPLLLPTPKSFRYLERMGRRTGESPLEKPVGYGFSLPLAVVDFVLEGEAVGPDEPSNIRAVGKPVPQGPPANGSGLEAVGDEGVGIRRCICPGFLLRNLPTAVVDGYIAQSSRLSAFNIIEQSKDSSSFSWPSCVFTGEMCCETRGERLWELCSQTWVHLGVRKVACLVTFGNIIPWLPTFVIIYMRGTAGVCAHGTHPNAASVRFLISTA